MFPISNFWNAVIEGERRLIERELKPYGGCPEHDRHVFLRGLIGFWSRKEYSLFIMDTN